MNVTRIKRKKALPERKHRFRIALAHVGISQAEWARREGYTAAHLSQVLSGKKASEPLDEKIAAFVAKYAGYDARQSA